MAYEYPKGLIPMTAGWVKNNPGDNTVMGVSNDNHGGVKVVKVIAEMLALNPNYLQKDYTACFVSDTDGLGKPGFFYLSSVPSNVDSTILEDWTQWEGEGGESIPGGLFFVGLLDPSNYTARDDDAQNKSGDFYIIDSATPVTINDPNFLNGVATEVYNNDWLIFNETLGYFEHVDRTFELIYTWAQITGKPQVIKDIENYIIFDHEHDANDVNINVDVDGTVYTKLDQLFGLIMYTNSIANDLLSAGEDQVLPYSLLKEAFIGEDEVDQKITDALTAFATNYYTKTEIDTLITDSNDAAFDWDRPIKKEVKIGDVLGGNTVTEGLEKLFDHIEPIVDFEKNLKIKRGVISNVSVTFTFTYNEATTIDSVTIYDLSDDSVLATVSVNPGDPSAIATVNAVELADGITQDWYVVVNYMVSGDAHSIRYDSVLLYEYVPMFVGGRDTSGDTTGFDVDLTQLDPNVENFDLLESNKYVYVVVPTNENSEFENGILDLNGMQLNDNGFTISGPVSVSITTVDTPYSQDFTIIQSDYKTSYDSKIYPR